MDSKWKGISPAAIAFLTVAIIVAASVAVIATQVNTSTNTTTASYTQTQAESSSTTVSQNGLRLSLNVDPTVAYPGDQITVNISDFNTLTDLNSPNMTGPPTVVGTALSLGPCSQLPLGFGIYQGNYQTANLSQATSLSLFQPGIYSCPAEFGVAYFTFYPQSDEIALYSPQPSGPGNSTVPNLMWTNPDNFEQSFSGYWTVQNQTCVFSCGVLHQFQPGVYTVVGGDDWGQLAIVHFTVEGSSAQSSSSTTSGQSSTSESATVTATSYDRNASADSINGLQLRVGFNTTVLFPGESLQVTVNEFNTLTTLNNVSEASRWPIQAELGSCPNVYIQPFGIAVYSGRADAQNISQATQLTVFAVKPCPMFVRLITGYAFQPQSDLAVVLPGAGASPVPMAANVNISMNYSGQTQRLPPGTYTLVAADEWGAMAFLYFIVQ
jgi:hypothetical protein